MSSSPPKPTFAQLQSFRLDGTATIPEKCRRWRIAPLEDIASAASRLSSSYITGNSSQAGLKQIALHMFNQASENISKSRTTALVCKALYEQLDEYSSDYEANMFREYLVDRVISFIEGAWEFMIVQRERSLFRDSTEVLDAVFTFFADIHAVGLLKSEVFSHWTAEVASIPSDVDQAYFSMVALTRGISYQGNRFSKETYVRIMDGVNTQFNLKRKGKNVFLTSAKEKSFRGIINSFMRDAYEHPDDLRCTLPFKHCEDQGLSCQVFLSLSELGVEERDSEWVGNFIGQFDSDDE